MSKLHEIAKRLGIKTIEAMKYIGATSPNQNISPEDERELEKMSQFPASKTFEVTKTLKSVGIIGEEEDTVIIFEHEFAGDALVNTSIWGTKQVGSRVQAIARAQYFAVKIHTGSVSKDDLE